MDPTQLTIAVMSCRANRSTKQVACQDTWIRTAHANKIPLVIVEGDPSYTLPHLRSEYELLVPAGDEYYDLRDKIRWLMRWFCTNVPEWCGGKYLFKCDDDTYVNIDRLLSLDVKKFEYIGRAINEGYAGGGAGYILSRRAARFVADLIQPKNLPAYVRAGVWGNNEDVAVGQIMRECGIELFNCRQFHHGNDGRPKPSNDAITGHHIQPGFMREIWAEFNPPPPEPPAPEPSSDRPTQDPTHPDSSLEEHRPKSDSDQPQ